MTNVQKDCYSFFIVDLPISQQANGLRYLRVGGRGQCLRCRKKPEARKMLLNRADSHTSGARFVGRFYGITQLHNSPVRLTTNSLLLSENQIISPPKSIGAGFSGVGTSIEQYKSTYGSPDCDEYT